jgi:hypothetical protein
MFWTGVILLCAAALSGCGRKAQALPPVRVNGASINVAAFQQAFKAAAPELQSKATSIRLSLSYGDFKTTERELAKLNADANLTEPQKQAVSTLSEQVTQASANTAN